MNIKNKLYISAGISIVLVVALVSIVLVTSGRIAEENKKHQQLMDVYESVSELDIVTYDYLLHREERMEYQWNIKHDSLGKILDGLAEEEGLKSMLEAEDYIKDNSEEAKEFAKDRFDYESDYMDYSWPNQEFVVTLEQAMLITFED